MNSKTRRLLAKVKRATEEEIHDLYRHVFGADFGGFVTLERARSSIIEALMESASMSTGERDE